MFFRTIVERTIEYFECFSIQFLGLKPKENIAPVDHSYHRNDSTRHINSARNCHESSRGNSLFNR